MKNDQNDYPEPLIDNFGRITDKVGKPLRDRRSRTSGDRPFHGHEGKVKVPAKLLARQKDYADNYSDGYSKSKNARHEFHKPGSNK